MSHRVKRSSLPTLDHLAPLFAALGDDTRLRLIAALCAGGATSITQLTAGTAHTRQAVTKHLAVLSAAGLVRGSKSGRERLWQFEPEALERARETLALIGSQWDSTLERLRQVLEQ
jgi:DNA-binding transcriptional ArsR family regulator